MGRIVEKNMPCKRCDSSDAVQVYEEGPAYCFSCRAAYNYYGQGEERVTGDIIDNRRETKDPLEEIMSIAGLPNRGMKERGITRRTSEFFGVRASTNTTTGELEKFYFPFSNPDDPDVVSGYKIKTVGAKDKTYAVGNIRNVFGLDKFKEYGRMLVITEGEEDAMAVAEASYERYGKYYPVASMGGVDQVRYLLEVRERILEFESVVLWFDNDTQGKKAVEEAAKILGIEKLKVVSSDEKDACDTYAVKGTKGVWDNVFRAKPYSPAGVLNGTETWEAYKQFRDMTFVPWPPFLATLNSKTFGRAIGSITMIAAGTGVGKSSLMREDISHIMHTTPAKVGVCFLEEGIGETAAAIMSIHLNKRLGLPNVNVTEEEERLAWEQTMGTGRIMMLDHQGAVSDGGLLSKLEHMIVSGCTYIYLDHITIAVSDSKSEDVNKNIDQFMSGLLRLVKRYPVWIGVVSHLRKVQSGDSSFESGAPVSEDDLKGSGSLKQVSFQTIALSRDKMHEDPLKRNRTTIWLLKDRKTGNTGPVGAYRFNADTGRLEEAEEEVDFGFETL